MKTKTFDVKGLVGLTEKKALAKITAAGMTARIQQRDKETFVGTCEFRTSRVNLNIQKGKVKSADIG